MVASAEAVGGEKEGVAEAFAEEVWTGIAISELHGTDAEARVLSGSILCYQAWHLRLGWFAR